MSKRNAINDPPVHANPFSTAPSGAYYTDFVLWQENSMLVLTPKFQRRKVWRTPAKSLLIDTMLRGMTIPPIYVRMIQNQESKKMVREVVDGQQRVHSVLEFVADEYRLAKSLNAPWAGKSFSKLTDAQRDTLAAYKFSIETFTGISDKQIFHVFSRLNMNGVQLNKQELRNGTYFGAFKMTAYEFAYDYLSFWRKHKIFSEMSLARMLEVELVSELLIAGMNGMQDKKGTIDGFYEKFEESYPTQARDVRRCGEVLATISEAFAEGELASTAFRRPPLFYSLFCVVYHRLFGLPGISRGTARKRLDKESLHSLRNAVVKLSDMVELARDAAADVPSKYSNFVAACLRQTDNIQPRRERFNSLFGEAF